MKMASSKKLADFLIRKADEYNQPEFIKSDPISIPHRFTRKQDIEISGFFAAVFAWGNRTIIIKKTAELMSLMDNAPYDFICNHQDSDLRKLESFKHRTFNGTDLLWFVHILQEHFRENDSLETAFFASKSPGRPDVVKEGLIRLNRLFFAPEDSPRRTRKHLSTPERQSGCKRLNMFLRWMVRKDNRGVDFGLWKHISPADLIIPIDLHVARVAKRFGLMERNQPDWKAAEELTAYFRTIDPGDPARFDFALFGLGVVEKF